MPGAFHYLHYRTFAHATEDPERVRRAIRVAAGEVPFEINEVALEGAHGNPVLLMEADIRGQPKLREVFVRMMRDDPAGFARLREEADRRLDDDLAFHFRIDKQEASMGRLALASSDDAVSVRGKVRVFQAGREEAVALVHGYLDAIARGRADTR